MQLLLGNKRGEGEKLSSLKYESPEMFTNENDGVMSMYHI